MKTKILIYTPVLISILLIFTTSACGRWLIKGQVVDAETGQTIDGAVVAIEWIRYKLGPPGLPSEFEILEQTEDVSDAEGLFKVPKYDPFNTEFFMSVYKKGYVCWSSRKIFPTFEERKDFDLKDGMMIKLEKFKEGYSREKHAIFTSSRPWYGSLFREAIKEEIKIADQYRERLKRNWKKRNREKRRK